MDILAVLADAARAAIGPQAAIYALAAIGLNIHFGYTGLLNFGQVAFMMVGAYGVAVTVAVFGGPLWLGVIVGLLCALALALILGIPTLRLRADYLAIATIAAGEVLRYIYRSGYAEPLTGGVYGLQQFADGFFALNPIPSGSYGVGRLSYSNGDLWVMVVGWLLVWLAALLVYLLMRSPWGRVLCSIREDEDAARSLGKNVFGYKMQSLVLGGVLGSLGGMLLAIETQQVQPDGYNPVITFYLYTLLVLGGAATVLGPLLGSVIFWFIIAFTDSFLRQGIGSGLIPSQVLSSADVGAVRFALVGLGLMLLMVFRPAGILGSRAEMLLAPVRRRARAPRPAPEARTVVQARAAAVEGMAAEGAAAVGLSVRGAGNADGATGGAHPEPAPLAGVPAAPGASKPDPVLVVEGVTRTFGGLRAVDVDRLEVQRGAITALIGPNGAGKTTFFNLLTGFDRPDAGTWSFNGRPIAGRPAHRVARMGMVRTFQLTKVLTRLTVMENMKLAAVGQRGERFLPAFAQPVWRRQEAEIERRAHELLERFRLADMRDEYAGTLSGGQRKLLEMARALMVEPALVMLDEPMAGVNPALTQSLLTRITDLRDLGASVLFVEHDMDVVMGISDWVVCMAQGRVIAEGPPAAVVADRAVIDAYLGGTHEPAPGGRAGEGAW